MLAIPLGWMQLKHQKVRFVVALSGIAFAVILIMMQLGFRSALFESAVRYQERLDYDLAIFNRESSFIVNPQSFSSRRLYQALAVEGVASVSPVYVDPATWKNPWNHAVRSGRHRPGTKREAKAAATSHSGMLVSRATVATMNSGIQISRRKR